MSWNCSCHCSSSCRVAAGIGNEAGKVFLFEHGPKKKKIREINVKGKVRATPVACNGTLYMITENPCKLYAIKK